MRILICSDGTDPADKPTKLGGLLAGPCHTPTTLLGIAEKPEGDAPLRAALDGEAKLLRGYGVAPEIVVREGEPIRQILNQTAERQYDIAIIGARRKGSTGLYCYSEKTYEVIKAIPTPVLVATGECEKITSLLVCTGGKHYIEDAVQLTGKLAACVGASVTLLHVMAEPPAIYADLVRLEEDVDGLLESDSELGVNLRAQKQSLENGRDRGGSRAAWDRHRSNFRRSATRRSRFDRDRFIAGARTAPALHHGRSHAQHSQPGELSGAGRSRRSVEREARRLLEHAQGDLRFSLGGPFSGAGRSLSGAATFPTGQARRHQ